MSLYRALRPLLFRLDAETAHHLAMRAISRGLLRSAAPRDRDLAVSVFGQTFPNPLGLAAGMDKDGVALNQWRRLGFGFVEMGTLTPRAQPGNPKPRMFRIPEERALINRLGFNNGGATAAAARLKSASPGVPVGVNLGRNKDVANEDAPKAYAEAARAFVGVPKAYLVVNVSSPNTPGLRQLQDGALLGEILSAVRETDPETPLLVKIAPDLELSAVDDVLRVALDQKLDGIVATNTTISRPVANDPGETGGLSGAPLAPLSRKVLRHLGENAPPSLTLIGVGGVMNGDDLFDRLSDGADLVQSYSGFVYGGPTFAADALHRLLVRMAQEGVSRVSDLTVKGRRPL